MEPLEAAGVTTKNELPAAISLTSLPCEPTVTSTLTSSFTNLSVHTSPGLTQFQLEKEGKRTNVSGPGDESGCQKETVEVNSRFRAD